MILWDMGVKGDAGIQGPKGSTGDQGDAGIQGPKEDRGEAGVVKHLGFSRTTLDIAGDVGWDSCS